MESHSENNENLNNECSNETKIQQSRWPKLYVTLFAIVWGAFCYYIATTKIGSIQLLKGWLSTAYLPIIIGILVLVPVVLICVLTFLIDRKSKSKSKSKILCQKNNSVSDSKVNSDQENKPDDQCSEGYKDIKILKGKIEFTAHGRSIAGKRFRYLDIISHLLLIWLSLSLLSWSIANLTDIEFGIQDNIYACVVGVLVLAFSILVFGFRFGETATLHEKCFRKLFALKLDLLQDEKGCDVNKFYVRYKDLLSEYPNHSDFDYSLQMIIRNWRKRRFLGCDKIDEKYHITIYHLIVVIVNLIIYGSIFYVFFRIGLLNFMNVICKLVA